MKFNKFTIDHKIPRYKKSVSSLSQAITAGANRKRAFSTPHISTTITSILNLPHNDENRLVGSLQLSGMLNSQSENFSTWPVQAPEPRSDTNIFTKIALGDERYMLPIDDFQREGSVGFAIGNEENVKDNDEDDEAIDQFSPTIYATANQSRAIPIPMNANAGNSPQQYPTSGSICYGASVNMGNMSISNRTLSPTNIAFSASPTGTGTHQYASVPQYYNGSPDGKSPSAASLPTATNVACSYDPAYGTSINRLTLSSQHHHQQQQQQQQPQLISAQHSQHTSPMMQKQPLEGATAVIPTAASPTSSQN
ncbi:protein bunched, class 2/F/G isoform-like, partial [Teleopsis dalmanni]|uniref:protein bunched, class 2/F/G isoform-like n=1 Tax=Teleopsis dalmanni TaxID=139649 RepID=UPI0018CD6E91